MLEEKLINHTQSMVHKVQLLQIDLFPNDTLLWVHLGSTSCLVQAASARNLSTKTVWAQASVSLTSYKGLHGVTLSSCLNSLRTQPSLGNTGYEPSKRRPTNTSCGPSAQKSKTTRSKCSPEHCHIDPEIMCQSWSKLEHVVALHPQFSGQRDELDEQSHQLRGWVPTGSTCSHASLQQ